MKCKIEKGTGMNQHSWIKKLYHYMKRFFNMIKQAVMRFFQWIKPHFIKLRQKQKALFHQYHVWKLLVIAVLVVMIVTTSYLFYLAKTQDVSALKPGIETTTIIYDQHDQEAGRLRGQKGTFVTLDEISPYMVDAVIASEDRRFYDHRGFDIKGMTRAFLGILKRGRIVGGGSTLTQQLAKNAFLTQKQTWDRKAKELFLAIELEKKYSKADILEMYLNYAYFGNGVWGVEDAAQKYFGVSASELDPSDAAVLTAILRNPGYYNPIDSMENATYYRNVILEEMYRLGYLDEAAMKQYQESAIVLNDTYSSSNDYRYPYYFDAVIDEAIHTYGISDEDLLNKGYQIYTALNQDFQQVMDTTFDNEALFPPPAEDGTLVQAASVALDPKTGGIEALEGGRGDYVTRGFNRATQGRIAPGSTLKPISVYTPALEAGFKPDDLLVDEPLPFYDVNNYDQTFRGEVTMREAVADSLNAPAVWLLDQIGLDRGVQKVNSFGISLAEEDHYYGLALGGLTHGTSPVKMAAAYGVFANEGMRAEPHLIRKIVDANGAVIVDHTQPKEKRVTSKKVAQDMTDLLLGVFTDGTGVAAQPYGYQMAGKTGTTENVNIDDQSKDQWVIGYTPDVVVATWIGFDESSEEHYLTGTSAMGVAQLFKTETEQILAYTPGTPFYEVEEDTVTSQEKQGSWIEEKIQDTKEAIQQGAEIFTRKIKSWLP